MAKRSTFPWLTLHMSILVVGLLFLAIPMVVIPTDLPWTPFPLESTSTLSITLNETSPAFRFNVTSVSSIVRITSLHTNDTPINLIIRGPAIVQFNATDVVSITEVPIEVKRVESEFWIDLLRQEHDATVSITLCYQNGMTATPIPYPPPPSYSFAPQFGTLFIVYALVQLIRVSSRAEYQQDMKFKLIAAALLVIVGSASCSPFITGFYQRNFVPVLTYVTLSNEEFLFSLNETHPSVSLNLASLYPQDATFVSFKIQSISLSDYPVNMTISDNNEYSLVLQESKSQLWFLPITTQSNQSIFLDFSRIENDTELSLSVARTYKTLLPREDITFPTYLLVIGVILIVLGLISTVIVDRHSLEEGTHSKRVP